MTQTTETQPETEIAEQPRVSSRRALFGIGAVLAAGAVAGE